MIFSENSSPRAETPETHESQSPLQGVKKPEAGRTGTWNRGQNLSFLAKLQLLKPIPKRAYELKLPLVPLIGKVPQLKEWQIDPLVLLEDILFWQEQEGITEWAVVCGRESGLFTIDFDLQKKNRKPCGPTLYGKLKEKAFRNGYRQKSQSEWQGFFAEHRMFAFVPELDFLRKGPLSETSTIDIITGDNSLVKIYKALPPGSFKSLFPHPSKELIRQLKAECGQKQPKEFRFKPDPLTGKIEKALWDEGKRHNLCKREAFAVFSQGCNQKALNALFHKALGAGLPEKEIRDIFQWCSETVTPDPGPEDAHRPPPNTKAHETGRKTHKKGPNTHQKAYKNGADSHQKQGKKEQKSPPVELKTNWLEDVQPEKIEYLDKAKLLPKGKLITLSGPKASLKSSGMLSYLLHEGLDFLYFSDWEVTEGQTKAIQKQAFGQGAKGNVGYAPLDQITQGTAFENYLLKEKKEKKISLCWEDPPQEDEFGSMSSCRRALTARAALADKTGASWLVSRNYSKPSGKQPRKRRDRINSFALWTNVPRAVLFTYPAEPWSKIFAEQALKVKSKGELEQLSLLFTDVVNVGPMPKHAVLLRRITDKKGKTYLEFELIERPVDPEKWGKGTTQAEKDKRETDTYRILSRIAKAGDKGIKSGDLTAWMIEPPLSFSTAKAERIKKELREKGKKHKNPLIQGGGQGAKNPITLTAEGKKRIEG